jgi:hypothetical protein
MRFGQKSNEFGDIVYLVFRIQNVLEGRDRIRKNCDQRVSNFISPFPRVSPLHLKRCLEDLQYPLDIA